MARIIMITDEKLKEALYLYADIIAETLANITEEARHNMLKGGVMKKILQHKLKQFDSKV